MQIPVTAGATAVLALLLVFLALRVSQLRLRHRVSLGDGGVEALSRAIRAHANTVEQVPIFLLLCGSYEIYAGASGFLIGIAAVFVLARLGFAWGLSRHTLSPARRLGAALTYLCQFLLPVALAIQVFTGIA